jgi:hypothetical protein
VCHTADCNTGIEDNVAQRAEGTEVPVARAAKCEYSHIYPDRPILVLVKLEEFLPKGMQMVEKDVVAEQSHQALMTESDDFVAADWTYRRFRSGTAEWSTR